VYSYNIMNLRDYFTKVKRPYSAYDVRVHGRGCAVAGEGSLYSTNGARQSTTIGSRRGAAPRPWSGELGRRGRPRGLAGARKRVAMAASPTAHAAGARARRHDSGAGTVGRSVAAARWPAAAGWLLRAGREGAHSGVGRSWPRSIRKEKKSRWEEEERNRNKPVYCLMSGSGG